MLTLRVKLAKMGWSQGDIDILLKDCRDIREVKSLKGITKKCEEMVVLPKYKKYLGLVDKMCEFLSANENAEICQIVATKVNGVWTFEVRNF